MTEWFGGWVAGWLGCWAVGLLGCWVAFLLDLLEFIFSNCHLPWSIPSLRLLFMD